MLPCSVTAAIFSEVSLQGCCLTKYIAFVNVLGNSTVASRRADVLCPVRLITRRRTDSEFKKLLIVSLQWQKRIRVHYSGRGGIGCMVGSGWGSAGAVRVLLTVSLRPKIASPKSACWPVGIGWGFSVASGSKFRSRVLLRLSWDLGRSVQCIRANPLTCREPMTHCCSHWRQKSSLPEPPGAFNLASPALDCHERSVE